MGIKSVFVSLDAVHRQHTGGYLRNRAVYDALGKCGQAKNIAIYDHLPPGRETLPRTSERLVTDIPVDLLASLVGMVLSHDPDIVVLDGVYLSMLARALRGKGPRVIILSHNVEHRMKREIDISRTPRSFRFMTGWIMGPTWRKMIRVEARMADLADAVWACSEVDRHALAALFHRKIPVHVVPNGVPFWCNETVPAGPQPHPDHFRLLFVGYFQHRPNVVTARRLVRDIFPALRRLVPQASVAICGRNPNRLVQRLVATTTGATLHANPPDLKPFYDRADAVMIPMTEGGGTRIKALEAMARLVPVVASSKAVEGLQARNDRHFLLAETDEEFVQTCHRLAVEPGLGARLAQNAHAYVRAHHMQDKVDACVRRALADLRCDV